MSSTEFKFSSVVFFGRGIDEYVKMFDLDLPDLRGKHVLDCAAGPAAFACQAADASINVVACDPLYAHQAEALRPIVDQHAASVLQKQLANPDIFHKELTHTSERRKQMEVFLEDFAQPHAPPRYVAAALPSLPFPNQSFDIVLLGNLLFIYSDIASGGMLEQSPFDYDFHSRAIAEMLRVCRGELRIYPLQGPTQLRQHAYLTPLMQECEKRHQKAEILPVTQRDIIGAEYMLRIEIG